MYKEYESRRSDTITDPALRQRHPISTIYGCDDPASYNPPKNMDPRRLPAQHEDTPDPQDTISIDDDIATPNEEPVNHTEHFKHNQQESEHYQDKPEEDIDSIQSFSETVQSNEVIEVHETGSQDFSADEEAPLELVDHKTETFEEKEVHSEKANQENKVIVPEENADNNNVVQSDEIGEALEPAEESCDPITESDKFVATESNKGVETESDKFVDTESDKVVNIESDKVVDTESDKAVHTESDKVVDTETSNDVVVTSENDAQIMQTIEEVPAEILSSENVDACAKDTLQKADSTESVEINPDLKSDLDCKVNSCDDEKNRSESLCSITSSPINPEDDSEIPTVTEDTVYNEDEQTSNIGFESQDSAQNLNYDEYQTVEDNNDIHDDIEERNEDNSPTPLHGISTTELDVSVEGQEVPFMSQLPSDNNSPRRKLQKEIIHNMNLPSQGTPAQSRQRSASFTGSIKDSEAVIIPGKFSFFIQVVGLV